MKQDDLAKSILGKILNSLPKDKTQSFRADLNELAESIAEKLVAKYELVTKEELKTQQKILKKTQEKLKTLEEKLKTL